jgi:hypothetical protein
MAKSKGRSAFGRASSGRSPFGRRGGTVTVIEDHVSRSYVRTAKIAFWVVSITIGLLAAVVISSLKFHGEPIHPIVALIGGAVIGAAVAFPISAFIAAWPVIRVIWWWLPEIAAAVALVYGFMYLCQHTPLPVRAATVAACAAPAAFGKVRAAVMKVAYCFISRHRIRTCFAEFIIGNNRASLPFMLWAKPTRVGESLWIWLRPGLARENLLERLDQIAVACWADKVTIERASATNAALVRVDITRRDALTGTVASPLPTGLPTGADATDPDFTNGRSATAAGDQTAPMGGLDFTDVPEEHVTNPTNSADTAAAPRNGARPKKPVPVPAVDDDPYADYR